MASHKSLVAFQHLLAISLVSALTACGGEPPRAHVAQRLAEDFSPKLISGAVRGAHPPPLAEWRFSPAAGQPGWEPFHGVDGFEVSGGLLKGESTSKVPLIRLPEVRLETSDLISEVQVRMRTSKTGKVGAFLPGREMKDEDLAFITGAEGEWPGEATVAAGERIKTFVIQTLFPLTGAEVGQILLRPTNVEGAHFEIESVRLVFRREHLASMPSGVGWHELSQAYREAVVSRAPESIRWEVDLPDKPRLTLSMGTVDARPVAFQVDVQPAGGEAETLFARTLTTPLRWEDSSLDLDRWRGRHVTLKLSLSGEPGAMGLWGSPVVRRRGPIDDGRKGRDGASRPQGVVLIVADTLRPDRLGVYGHQRPTAPVLARMASEGTLFRDVNSQGTWTKVSGPSLLTSMTPLSTGVRHFEDRLPASATTLAEVFRAAGYATAGYSSVPFMGTFNNLHQGYESLHEVPENDARSKTARHLVDALLPWLDEHGDEPFFVFLHLFDPHDPYEPDVPYNRLWADPSWYAEHQRNRDQVRPFIADPRLQGNAMPSRAELEAAGLDPATYVRRELDFYDGSIRAMDVEIGRVMERLRDLGLDQKTLVAFTSDHGEEFHDHGRMYHGQSVYGELTHVPLIVRYPGVTRPGRVVEETVSLLDVMPTLLDLSGLQVPAQAQGQSLAPLLRETGGASHFRPKPVFSEKPADPAVLSSSELESFAVVEEGWKLVWNVRRPNGVPELQLFDHRRDPRDLHDVAGQHPEIVKRLQQRLSAWRKSAVASRLPSDEESSRGMTPEERERLRSLGYLQ